MTYLEITPADISEFSPPLTEDNALETAIDKMTVNLARFAPAELPEDFAQDLTQTTTQNTRQNTTHETTEDMPEPRRDGPLSFPPRPNLIYTARLRALLPVFISQLFSMFSPDHIERGAISRIAEIRKMLSALFRTEKHNYAASLTAAIEENPNLQAQIREDLGGEAALRRWELRAEKSREQTPSKNPLSRENVKSTSRQSRPSRPRKILTDRTGLFRLASLANALKPRSPRSVSSLGNRAASFRAPGPIGLTPDQLRPRANMIAALRKNDIQLQELWQAMQEDHFLWDHLLMIADFMTRARAFREEYAPP